MPKAPEPENEAFRLRDLKRLEILDSAPEECFDRITRVAAKHFQVPISLVSLIDRDRQWFKSRQGLDVSETSRAASFCAYTILQRDLMIVEDALEDPRFADSPLVMDNPNIRFYAGAPLVSRNGFVLGTLCLIDTKPKKLDPAQTLFLEELAAIVSELIELRLSERSLKRELPISKQQNKLLRESELRLQSIFDSVLDSILVLNAEGLVYAHNEAAEKLFGYANVDLLGRHSRELMPDYFDQEAAEYFENFRTRNTRQIFLDSDRGLQGLRSDGSRFPLELTLSAMQFEGEYFYNVIIRDITQQKAAEQALFQAKKQAETLTQAKGDFLLRASHELRTPLNSIIGFSDILMEDLAGSIPEKALEYLQLIQRGGKHLSSLINEIFEISRIETGKQTLVIQSVDIDALVSECWDLMEPQATGRNLSFYHHIEPGEPRHVRADPERLKQVLMNLLSNAIKYNQADGKIEIRVRKLGTGNTVIDVSDTGNGIPANKSDAIFNVFEKLTIDEHTVEGSGIGLALCKTLVNAMDGEIGVDSIPEKGSTFWVSLKTASPAEIQSSEKKASLPGQEIQSGVIDRPCSILYVGDNPVDMSLIETLLDRSENVELLSANRAAMAYAMAIQHQPDLILLDLHLPDTDDLTVLQKFRSMPRTAAIPILIVSAEANSSRQERLLAAGAEGYLTKPVDQALLLTQVATILSATAATTRETLSG